MNKIYKYLIFTLLVLMPFGCSNEDLVELNINPTQANEVDWRFLFTNGIVQTVENRYINGRVNLNLASGLIQQTACQCIGGERGSGDKYFYHLDSHDGLWFRLPEFALKTLAEVMRQTGPEGSSPNSVNLFHAAQTLYMVSLHQLTDAYGNIPYTELNQGIEGIFFPAYDEQEFIYKDMLARLQASANALGTGSDELGSADVLFNGDLTKWKKFANSLMLRLAMRISNVDPATAQQYAEAAVAGGVMESNDDMAWLQMADGPSVWFNQNGISRAMNPSDWGAINMLSKTFVDQLQSTNDPRLEVISVRGPWDGPWLTDPADQIGMPNGMDVPMLEDMLGKPLDRENDFSRINPELLDNADPFIIMTHAEIEFLRAEMVMKGWNNSGPGAGTAEEHFNRGVTSSMLQWDIFGPTKDITLAEVNAYLAANPFDGTMEMLHTQHWIANFFQWHEAYANWRRTGFPTLTPVDYPGNDTGGQIFRRYRYASYEIANNNANLQAGGTMPDDMMTRIWWDVN